MLVYLRKFLLVSLALAVLAVSAAYLGLQHWYKTTHLQVAHAPSPYLLNVQPGTHARRLTNQLAAEGLLTMPRVAYWAVRLFAGGSHLQAGVYQVEEGDTLAQFWQKVATGQQHYFSITF